MRRWLVPVVLGLLTVSAGTGALRATGPGGDEEGPGSALEAPVLSVRRMPVALSRLVADTRLRASLDQALADPSLAGGRDRSCLVVRQGRRQIFGRRADQQLIPASNLKVLTGLAMLDRLAPTERLVTEVRAGAGVAPGGVVDGPLWLVGGGDPLLATADYAASFPNQPQLYTSMERLADEVVGAGVREVRGGVVGDEGRYDTQRYVPTWKPGYVALGEVGPLSALLVNDGFTEFRGRHTPAPEPDLHAAAVLTGLLQARGVAVAGAPAEGRAPPGAAGVARIASPPMREVVAQMLRESDNVTAELLVKELGYRFGGQGTTAAGLRVVRDTLAAMGLPVAHLSAVDGSGLDRSDRATCALLMTALDAAGPRSPLAEGFPVAGRDGTLARRFVGSPAAGRLRAKTGALEGVTGLSGYVDVPAGEPMVFSMLANDIPRDAAGRALQERVGAILARYPEAPPPDTLAP